MKVTTWCPRYMRRGRLYRPPMLVRRLEPVAGRPAVRIELRPAADYGARAFTRQLGSHHVRFLDASQSLRVTTDAPVSYLTEDRVFVLERPVDLVMGEDETLGAPAHEIADETLRATVRYWQEWVRGLAVPFEWQEETIRAAITLQLCTYEDNGAVLAAPTTSIPEAADSGRNWDYRYCWLRDAYFTVQALNRLGATGAMESYLRYLDESWQARRGRGCSRYMGSPVSANSQNVLSPRSRGWTVRDRYGWETRPTSNASSTYMGR